MTFVTVALVLSTQSIAEKDVLLRVLTPERGLFDLVAKGGKKSKRRFVNILEPFSLLRIHVRPGRATALPPFLDQADLLEPFEGLRASFRQYLKASYLCELAESLLRPRTGQEVFRPLLQALYFLTSEKLPWELLKPYFELQILAKSGFMPRLKDCVRCSQELTGSKRFFAVNEGGVVCEDCFREGDLFLSPSVQALLLHLQRISPQKLSRLRPSAENLKQAGRIIENFLLYVVDREINSLRILKEML